MKTAKKALCLIFVLLLSINSFAAIVSDNDGSAFVTKNEFEALKDDFATQVENYETSIDGKIDGAISAYLAGIKLTTKTIIANLFKNAKEDNKKNLMFMKWATPSTPYNKDDITAGYFVGRSDGCGGDTNQTSGGKYGYMQVSNVNQGSGGYNECPYLGTTKYDSNNFYNDSKKNWTSGFYFVEFPFKGEDEKTDLENWTLKDIKRKRLWMHLKANYVVFQSAAYSGNIGNRYTGTLTTDYTTDITQPGSFKHTRQGTNGHQELTPVCTQVHEWTDLDKDSNFSSEDDKKQNAFLEYNIGGIINNNVKCYAIEYEYRDYYNSSDEDRFGSKEAKTLQIQDRRRTNTDAADHRGCGSRINYLLNGSDVKSPRARHDVTFNFKYYFQKQFDLKWTNLTNSYYDKLFNKPHYVYYGIPIANLTQSGKVSFRMTLDNSTADEFKYSIMDTQHGNVELEKTKTEKYNGYDVERVMAYGELSGKKMHVVDIEFDKEVLWDKNDGDYLFLKVEPSKVGQIITADIPGNVNVEYKTY